MQPLLTGLNCMPVNRWPSLNGPPYLAKTDVPLAALYSRQAVDLERRGMLARWLLPMSFPVSSGCTSMAKTMPSSEATDGDIFLAYIEQVLGPKLRPGD